MKIIPLDIVKIALCVALLICLSPAGTKAQNRGFALYQQGINTINSGQINLSQYKGKKILVVITDAAKPDKKLLVSLDSVYQKNKAGIVVIAIPVTDFAVGVPKDSALSLLVSDSLHISYPVTSVCKAQKANGNNQQSLLAYLTDKTKNGHFDIDITGSGEMFAISEKGKLYGRFTLAVNPASPFMNKIIQQQVSDY